MFIQCQHSNADQQLWIWKLSPSVRLSRCRNGLTQHIYFLQHVVAPSFYFFNISVEFWRCHPLRRRWLNTGRIYRFSTNIWL